MKNFFRSLILPVLFLASLSMTACGGGGASSSSGSSGGSGGSSGSGGSTTPQKVTPGVTITPSSSDITVAQPLNVTVTVSGGATTATGSVVLSAGSYTSSPTTLSSGSAVITIPANTLAVGAVNLSAAYTPDSNSSSTFNSGSSTSVSILVKPLTAPAIAVTPSPVSIAIAQSLSVAVSVNGGSGNPTPTGTVVLSGGGYTSSAATLSAGSASFNIPANTLSAGSVTLTATYTPDTTSSVIYASSTGAGSVAVLSGPTITSFSANLTTIVAGGSGTQLTAVFGGGTGVITPGSNGTTGSISVTSGSPVTVSPTLNTTYTLTVTPAVGSAVTQTLMLTVDPSISVCMSASCSGPAISNLLLGMNLPVWYDDPATASSIVPAFESAGITALRWPGGSTSDDYHWNGGTANPPNGTAPVPSTCNGAYQNPDTNYLNFINDLELADAGLPGGGYDIALTADYGTNPACNGGGDPNEAANWVQYAYANGGKVSYVTVGNESYGSWEEDMHAVQHDPTTYAAAVSGSSGYYDLIKAQSAATKVGVVVNANCTTSNGCTNGWDSTVLSSAVGCNGTGTPCYDFVEYHYYPQYSPPSVTSDTFLVQQAAQEFTTNITTIKTELQTAGAPNTPIYVGELGANSSNPGTQSWSITQGLYAGQLLGEAMNDGVTRLTWWIGFGNCLGSADITGTGGYNNNNPDLYGWQNTWGSYDVFSDADPNCPGAGPIGTMSPTGEAFNLAQKVIVAGQTPQRTTVTGDTTDVRAYAATSGSSGGAAVMLFNRNETTAQTVSLSLTGTSLTSASSVTVTTYDKEIYDYTNVNCQADQPACTYDPTHDYSTAQWAPPVTTTMTGPVALPLTVTLQPWSITVVTVQP
jgi:hypothetical protein